MKTMKIAQIHTGLHAGIVKILVFSMTALLLSCDEEAFLEEKPLDFFSPENSYVTFENFESAVVNLYAITKEQFYIEGKSEFAPVTTWACSDFAYTMSGLGMDPDWGGALLLPTNTLVVYEGLWKPVYKLIYDTNVIIGRADADASQLTDEEKVRIKAEASFFRAYAYRILAHVYGGVPLVLEEVQEPKRDFFRATRNEVYEQCVSDLEFAADNLPDIGDVDDSRVNSLAAYHLLSEVYISLGRWQDAIDAATAVIDHPGTALMTERFGTRVDEEPHPDFPWVSGGDVYWDLFRLGNQNYSTGNTEAIWTIQFEFQSPGGGAHKSYYVVPMLWRAIIPNLDETIITLLPQPNTYYFGRGTGFIRPTQYFFETIWEKSGYDLDIRNSEYNIVRDFKVNNPDSDYNGLWVLQDNVPISLSSQNDTMRFFFPAIAKAYMVGNTPIEHYHPDQTVPGSLVRSGRDNYREKYAIRLAETYLLRAEAHLGNNDATQAAEDINVVRRRSNAPDVSASEVDIDYILDERLRELYYEEFRLFTLCRLGKLVERMREYNPVGGTTIADHNNLWPIPYDDIEKNIGGNLEQNPGY